MLALCSLVSACGFTLRGQNELPAAFHHIYVQADSSYEPFTKTLKQELRLRGVKLAHSPQETVIHIIIKNRSFEKNTPNIGTSDQVRVYSLRYRLTFEIKGIKSRIKLPPQTLTVHRQLTLNVNQMLHTNDEVQIIKHEMEAALIHQLINRLHALKVNTS